MRKVSALFVVTVLRRDWRFLAMTVVSCTVAATVATFQFSVYNSFQRASAVVPQALAGDFWVKAGSVECFDFPTPFPEDYAGVLARYFPEARMQRVVFGFAPWRSPLGKRGNVAVVGVEGFGIGPHGFIANVSDLQRLGIGSGSAPTDATIGDTTLTLEGTVSNLSTYLGAPYVLADFETARRLLRMDPTSTAFLVGRFGQNPPADFARLAREASRRNPDVTVVSGADFANSSIGYWQRKTGAGMAIGLAAVLALLLMAILFANGVLRFIQHYHTDLLSLLGHGATRRDIAGIVAGIAGVVAAITLASCVVITPLIVFAFSPLLPWTAFSAFDLVAPLLGILIALAAAMLSTRGALQAFAPDAVFRN
ncbi:MAG: hypothetical protein ACKOPE_09240 [Novosphingobium sp.]